MLLVFFSFLLIATGNIDVGTSPIDENEGFGRIIRKATYRLEQVAPRRPLRLSHLNDSLAHTSQAARGIVTGEDESTVLETLRQARRAYPNNSFAILLQGIVEDAGGDQATANQLFEKYLLKSRTFSDFDEVFLKWAEFHRLRRYVYDLLQDRGISFKGREKEIQVMIPFEAFLKYLMRPSRADLALNIVFVALILGGRCLADYRQSHRDRFFKTHHSKFPADVCRGLDWIWNLDRRLNVGSSL